MVWTSSLFVVGGEDSGLAAVSLLGSAGSSLSGGGSGILEGEMLLWASEALEFAGAESCESDGGWVMVMILGQFFVMDELGRQICSLSIGLSSKIRSHSTPII